MTVFSGDKIFKIRHRKTVEGTIYHAEVQS